MTSIELLVAWKFIGSVGYKCHTDTYCRSRFSRLKNLWYLQKSFCLHLETYFMMTWRGILWWFGVVFYDVLRGIFWCFFRGYFMMFWVVFFDAFRGIFWWFRGVFFEAFRGMFWWFRGVFFDYLRVILWWFRGVFYEGLGSVWGEGVKPKER